MNAALDVKVTGMVRDYGDCALLVECANTADVLAWTETLQNAELPGVLDIVPASRSVLLKLAGPRHQLPIRQKLIRLAPGPGDFAASPPDGKADVTIDVVYDGADLIEVGQLTGLDPVGVIAAHTAAPWRVGFCGFAPGFAYLVGGDARLRVQRRAEPRTHVPAGAVGLAGEFSGIYPRVSPGGWQLIGRTEAVLWDLDRPSPALLAPGMWVQFRAV
jgi:KipI family sensor histidine kinase inhibitor